ncbi:hypothetical protein N8855_00760 [bacterium]|nr:hypothetical protein [bacterium]
MKRFLKISSLILLLIVVGFFFLIFNHYTDGNEYARYENISVSGLSKDQVNKLESRIDEIAHKHNLLSHVFNYEDSKTTRYYKKENLSDGVIDIRTNDLLVSIYVRWVNKEYGDFLVETCSYIRDMNFDFSVPYTTVGNEVRSQLTKSLILEQGCTT